MTLGSATRWQAKGQDRGPKAVLRLSGREIPARSSAAALPRHRSWHTPVTTRVDASPPPADVIPRSANIDKDKRDAGRSLWGMPSILKRKGEKHSLGRRKRPRTRQSRAAENDGRRTVPPRWPPVDPPRKTQAAQGPSRPHPPPTDQDLPARPRKTEPHAATARLPPPGPPGDGHGHLAPRCVYSDPQDRGRPEGGDRQPCADHRTASPSSPQAHRPRDALLGSVRERARGRGRW